MSHEDLGPSLALPPPSEAAQATDHFNAKPRKGKEPASALKSHQEYSSEGQAPEMHSSETHPSAEEPTRGHQKDGGRLPPAEHKPPHLWTSQHPSPVADISEEARPSQSRPPPGVYHYSVPVRPIRADISIEHLERLSTYYGIYGSLLLVPGIAAFLFPLLTSADPEQIFGWALLGGAAVSGLQFLFLLGAPGTWTFLALTLLHLSVGFWLVSQPFHGIISVAVILAAWLLAGGVLKVILSVAVSSVSSWPMLLLSGVVSIALAVTVLSLFPSYPLWILGGLVGADFVLTGLSLMAISLLASWALEMVSSTEEPLLGVAHNV